MENMTIQQIENSSLALHAPGQQHSLLSYIAGESDFPVIELGALTGWHRAFVTGGHLRQYVERLRMLSATGENPEGTYLACPLCPMPLCGVGLDAPEAADASCAHALEHLAAYRKRQGSSAITAASV